MRKKIILVACMTASLITLDACGSKRPKTANGLEYQIHVVNENGRLAQRGDIIQGKMTLSSNDSVLFALEESEKILQIAPSIYPGDLNEGLLMMHEGDSISFFVPVDSLNKYMGGGLPGFVKDYMVYSVKVDKLYTQEEVEAEAKAKEAAALEAEKAAIAQYIKDNNIKVKPQESGIYFISTKRGSGNLVKQGQKVKVNYAGYLLDGRYFDTNIESVAKEQGLYNPQRPYEPMEVSAGVGQMIPGFDEALLLMRKGGKATVIIPFAQAYGSRDMGPDLPAFSTLVFEMEITDVQ